MGLEVDSYPPPLRPVIDHDERLAVPRIAIGFGGPQIEATPRPFRSGPKNRFNFRMI
jgi:hypothetical protein